MNDPSPAPEKKEKWYIIALRVVGFFAVINGLTLLLLGGDMAVFTLPVINIILIASIIINLAYALKDKKK